MLKFSSAKASKYLKALTLPAVKEKLAAQGVEPLPISPQEFDAMIANEIVSNVKLAKAAGLKFN